MLTKIACDQLEPREKSYKKFDAHGLYIEVSPKGSKNWRLKYYFRGKEKRISLGRYPIITLSKARSLRDDARRLLSEGVDPSAERQRKREEIDLLSNSLFELVAMEWYEKRQENWSPARKKYIYHTLTKNIFPFLGKRPISEISPPDLYQVLLKIEDRGAYYETNRTNQVCKQVFKYGIQIGKGTNNPADQLTGAFKTRKTQHFASLDSSDIPELLKAVEHNDARLYASTRNAILLSLYTFCRPGEIRRARWFDMNIENEQWIIPKDFMKADRDHMVPLAKQTIKLLKSQREETAHIRSEWVFPSITKPEKPMSDGTVNVALKKLGFHKRMTAHGFRALARTTIREKLKYYPDIIEAQLAHKPPGPLGAAYDRSQFIEDRIQMMQDWADFVSEMRSVKN